MLVMAGRWFRVCCVYPQDCHAAGQFNDLPFFVITSAFGHTQSLIFPSLPFPSIVPTAQQKRDRKLAFL